MKCALLDIASDTILREQDFSELPPLLAPEKGWQWFEVVDTQPTADLSKQRVKPDGHTTNARVLTKNYRVEALPQDTVNANFLKTYDRALTDFLDKEAKKKQYDNRITCALRAGYTGPYQAEGQAFGAWMDACNQLGYQIMDEVVAGTRPQPTIEEFLAQMPPMVWPT